MGEVYAGRFRRVGERVEAIGDERVCAASALRFESDASLDVIGTGWSSYRDAIAAALPSAPRWAQGERYPQATDVARLAMPIARSGGGVAADQVLPVYLRDKVALTLAEQRR
jgi:tRNA threonylcarbamoyladenosine biosynthesis protein TsaB